MPPPCDVIRADFDRIAVASSTLADGIERCVRPLVAEVPLRGRVLEIGCGTGALARELATKRGTRVTAIDLSPRMVDIARARTPDSLGIEYRVADLMALAPRGFDVAISTNTLHHLPLARAAEHMANAVAPGGIVLISDLFDARGVLELPYNALSWLTQPRAPRDPQLAARRWEDRSPGLSFSARSLGLRSAPPLRGASAASSLAWQAHGEHDDLLPLSTIKKLLASVMPGIAVTRHLGWRYTAIWRKP